jgi:hypothetical protein
MLLGTWGHIMSGNFCTAIPRKEARDPSCVVSRTADFPFLTGLFGMIPRWYSVLVVIPPTLRVKAPVGESQSLWFRHQNRMLEVGRLVRRPLTELDQNGPLEYA